MRAVLSKSTCASVCLKESVWKSVRTARSLSISQPEIENSGQVPEELYPASPAQGAQIITRTLRTFSPFGWNCLIPSPALLDRPTLCHSFDLLLVCTSQSDGSWGGWCDGPLGAAFAIEKLHLHCYEERGSGVLRLLRQYLETLTADNIFHSVG